MKLHAFRPLNDVSNLQFRRSDVNRGSLLPFPGRIVTIIRATKGRAMPHSKGRKESKSRMQTSRPHLRAELPGQHGKTRKGIALRPAGA